MLKPGTPEYEKHLQEEIEHYSEIFAGRTFAPGERSPLFQPVPGVWEELERRASGLIARGTGADLNGHVLQRLNVRPGVRLLSLGCGPGGIELSFARLSPSAAITCIDINERLLELGRQTAAAEHLNVSFETGDLNTVSLPENSFDLIFCHASLHHVVELELLIDEIVRALTADGQLIVLDVISRNGYLMWPETRKIVEDLWLSLPSRFKINRTAYGDPRLDVKIWEANTSQTGMECIRSEEIVPLLEKRLEPVCFVPYFTISRRFFDTMYGPNYDLGLPLDRSLFEWIWQLDLHYLSSGMLRPETFFGIYSKKSVESLQTNAAR